MRGISAFNLIYRTRKVYVRTRVADTEHKVENIPQIFLFLLFLTPSILPRNCRRKTDVCLRLQKKVSTPFEILYPLNSFTGYDERHIKRTHRTALQKTHGS